MEPISALLLASGGLNATGTLMNMFSTSEAEERNSIIARTNAILAEMEAEQAATRAREHGESVSGTARAAFAASGVSLRGGGTVDTVERKIRTDSERDAYAALLTGQRMAADFRAQADQHEQNASDALLSGVIRIGETVMNTGYNMARWNRGMTA